MHSPEGPEVARWTLRAWARTGSCTRCRRGRGRGPTKSMAAPALRYFWQRIKSWLVRERPHKVPSSRSLDNRDWWWAEADRRCSTTVGCRISARSRKDDSGQLIWLDALWAKRQVPSKIFGGAQDRREQWMLKTRRRGWTTNKTLQTMLNGTESTS
jgi:hypothetical protein